MSRGGSISVVTCLAVLAVWGQLSVAQYAVDPPCNNANSSLIPSVGQLDPDAFKGKWYLKYATMTIPRLGAVSGYENDVTFEDDDPTIMTIKVKASLQEKTDCSSSKWQCALDGDTCQALTFNSSFIVIATDYKSVLVLWSETEDEGGIYPILSIYVRDPFTPPDLTSVQTQVQEFCGADATDVNPVFYETRLPYDNTPFCFYRTIPPAKM